MPAKISLHERRTHGALEGVFLVLAEVEADAGPGLFARLAGLLPGAGDLAFAGPGDLLRAREAGAWVPAARDALGEETSARDLSEAFLVGDL
jgi:hypothetical protein